MRLALFGLVLAPLASAALAAEVVVNAQRIDATTVQRLERAYGVPIQAGRYWYDRVSGVWGVEGGPAAGQIHPGLPLGGPVRGDASRGDTGVFVNGRQLHRFDVLALQRCTPVLPGRYWVLANGVGGHEGFPATFNLAALCGARAGGGRGSSTRCQNYGGGQFSCSNPNTGIGMISEGGGRGAVFVDGKVIMTPN